MIKKVIIDTDIGDDIDDAFALAYLLNQPQAVDILGVTTVFLNTRLRARQVKHLFHLAGRHDIPVYAGIGKPYVKPAREDGPLCQFTDDLMQERCRADNEDEPLETAIDYIIEMARTHGEELTILSIGPLTNIARAIEKAPEVMANVGCYIMMGGCFFDQFLEWNILCDPEAARIVFDAPINLTCIGTDVTNACDLTIAQRDQILADHSTPLNSYLATIFKLWLDNTGRVVPTLHDPLAASMLVDDSFVSYKKQRVRVEINGELTRGMTVNFNRCYHGCTPINTVRVASAIDAGAFIGHFLHTLNKSKIDKQIEEGGTPGAALA